MGENACDEVVSLNNNTDWVQGARETMKLIKQMDFNTGREEGKLEGKLEGILATARNLLGLNAERDFIVKSTGLSPEEIDALALKMN